MFTFKLPDNVSFGEGALVEPWQWACRRPKSGDPGRRCRGSYRLRDHRHGHRHGSTRQRLQQGHHHGHPATETRPAAKMGNDRRQHHQTGSEKRRGQSDRRLGSGRRLEASGNETAVLKAFEPLRPGGCVVFIGMPVKPYP